MQYHPYYLAVLGLAVCLSLRRQIRLLSSRSGSMLRYPHSAQWAQAASSLTPIVRPNMACLDAVELALRHRRPDSNEN